MLNRTEHPVAWALLMYQLGNAHEHLGDLIKQMMEDTEFDENDYRVHLGHVFAHLNRAWHQRGDTHLDVESEELWNERSKFPVDLSPVE